MNGHKRTFAVGDLFQYGENVYGKNGMDPMISALQTYLLSLYYTPERISDFFASAKDVVVRQGDVVRTINLTHILDSIRYAKQITDYGEIQKLLQSQNEPIAYITAYKTGKRVRMIVKIFLRFLCIHRTLLCNISVIITEMSCI